MRCCQTCPMSAKKKALDRAQIIQLYECDITKKSEEPDNLCDVSDAKILKYLEYHLEKIVNVLELCEEKECRERIMEKIKELINND